MTSRFNTFTATSDTAISKFTHKAAQQRAKPAWQPKTRSRVRQLSVMAIVLGVSACSSSQEVLSEGAVGFVEGFIGGVVADEPRAALVGRDILSAGGSAADAVTAMYFTQAVTLPSRAGLGGGGVCVAFDQATGTTRALDFSAPRSTVIAAGADRPTAVPGNPRGFFALQARYGKLLWRQVVTPGETLARFGYPMSRAFAQDVAAIGPALLADRAARRVFGARNNPAVGAKANPGVGAKANPAVGAKANPGVGAKANPAVGAKEGDKIEQLDLAGTLGMLRARGVGPFYSGPFARNFVAAAGRAGGTLTVEELRAYVPRWRDTVRVKMGNEVAHFAPPPAAASSQAAIVLATLIEQGDFADNKGALGEGVRAHLMAETAALSFADREGWLDAQGQSTAAPADLVSQARIDALAAQIGPQRKLDISKLKPQPRNRQESPATASFMAADAAGNAVACSVTMNASFGTGRIAQGTGVLLAAAPDPSGRGPTGLAPMLLVNENSREFRMAAAAGGGVHAPVALAGVVARIRELGQSAKQAVSAPRVDNTGDPNVTLFEPGLSPAAQSLLTKLGHATAKVPRLGRVNVLSCPDGLPTRFVTCEQVSDPRGQGLAAGSMM